MVRDRAGHRPRVLVHARTFATMRRRGLRPRHARWPVMIWSRDGSEAVVRERWRRSGMMLALVAAAFAPAGPAAAAEPITFSHTFGTRCVAGEKPTTGRITLTLLASNGRTRATTTSSAASANERGYEVCFKVMPRAGDRLKAVRGSVRRSITIPTLTTAIDRVTDVVSGKAPK